MITDIYDILEENNERTSIMTDTDRPNMMKKYVFKNERRRMLIERMKSVGLKISDFAFDPKIKETRASEKERRSSLVKSLTPEDTASLLQNETGIATMEFF